MAALSLRAAAAVTATDRKGWDPGPLELMYVEDLHRPFGVPVDEELLRTGAGLSHLDLAERLLADAEIAGATRDADLLVVASGLPDLHPYTPLAPHLHDRLGMTGRRFTITEQGSTAPFTAIRVASAGHRCGRTRRAAVLVVEQSTHPARGSFRERATPSDSAALLVLEEGPGPRIEEVAQVHGTGPAALEDRLATLADGPGRALVVLGPHTDPALRPPAGAQVHRAGRTAYATGVWLELARHHAAWTAAYDRIVLCETDARAPGRSALLVLTTAPCAPTTGGPRAV
ncbi:hypothetical protein [Streptomyces misionensis]|uniref:hypothetical protein n=1 Tax=Streptomyces misionensis TaxID=67331 RepID=UPI0033E54067